MVLTMPSSVIAASLLAPLGCESPVQPRMDASGIVFENRLLGFRGQVRGLQIADGVIEVVTGGGVFGADCADHFGGEEDIFVRDDFKQGVNAGLMVHARVEVHVV